MSAFGTLAMKDLAIEFRTKEALNIAVVIAFSVLILFGFGGVEGSAAVLWAAFIFAGTITLSRSFAKEKDRGTLEGLLALPVSRNSIYFAKLASNLAVMFVVEAITLVAYAVLFGAVSLGLCVVVVIGTVAFVSSGTLISAIASNTRSSGLMMPVLFFPVLVPVLISAVSGAQRTLDGDISNAFDELRLLFAYSAVFMALGYAGFEYIVEE